MTQYAFELRFREADDTVSIPCSVSHVREVLRLVDDVIRDRPKAEFEGIVYYAARI